MFLNIEAERARRKLSQQYLAEYLGVSPRTFSNWIGGKTEIPCSAITKMSQLFDCSTDYLLGISDERR